MTRYIHGIYKHGRATSVSQELLKVKRFLDDEAIIEGFEELYRNENEATENAYGRTVRSSHQAGKVPADTLGALRVRNSAGQSFSVGTGFDFATREEIWKNQAKYLGQRITYKYVKVGGYDVPRFPVFKGFRPEGV
jgi:DNA ligase-1